MGTVHRIDSGHAHVTMEATPYGGLVMEVLVTGSGRPQVAELSPVQVTGLREWLSTIIPDPVPVDEPLVGERARELGRRFGSLFPE